MEPSIKLSSGYNMPLLGFGTYKDPKGNSVSIAIDNGIRHIDCAEFYGNQKEIGAILKNKISNGIVDRKDLFITSKLYNTCHEAKYVRKHCEKTLNELGLDYLDLYLIHWPISFKYNISDDGLISDPIDEHGKVIQINVPLMETWLEMEKLVETGLVKSIGVSNFNVQSVVDLWSYAKIKPSVNQVEFNPRLVQNKLKSFCDVKNIHLSAYSPYGQGALNNDQDINVIAKKYNKSIQNVICKYLVQKGLSVISKSSTKQHIIDNFNIHDFQLSIDDINYLDSLNKGLRIYDPSSWWGIPLFD